jgi:hypothetical protein
MNVTVRVPCVPTVDGVGCETGDPTVLLSIGIVTLLNLKVLRNSSLRNTTGNKRLTRKIKAELMTSLRSLSTTLVRGRLRTCSRKTIVKKIDSHSTCIVTLSETHPLSPPLEKRVCPCWVYFSSERFSSAENKEK